jgi:PAS domain S-box-containing protein
MSNFATRSHTISGAHGVPVVADKTCRRVWLPPRRAAFLPAGPERARWFEHKSISKKIGHRERHAPRKPEMLKFFKRNLLLRYALPPVFLTLAVLAAELLHAVNPGLVEYTFLAGVVAAAWLGGRGPGLIAAVLAPLVLDYFFLPPLYTIGISREALPAVVPFVLAGLAAAWISSARAEATEAKAAQLQNYEKFRRVLSNLPDVTWTSDQFGRMLYISPKVEKVLGYTEREIYAGGIEFLLSRTHPDDVGGIVAVADALFKQRKGFDIEFRYQRKDGEWIWLQNRALGAYEQEGAVRADGVIADITQRKNAEIELREKTAFLEAQINSSIDGILVVDANVRRILHNKRVVELFDIPVELMADPDQVPAREHMIKKFKHPEQKRELVRRLYLHPEETSRGEFELTDGRIVDLYSSPVKGPGGEYYGRIWTYRDITALKKNEAELKAKTAFLEAQVNASIDGILVVDGNGRRTLMNQRLIDFFAISPEILSDPSDAPMLGHVLTLVKEPASFLMKIRYLNEHPSETSRDEIEFNDGRVFDRYSAPVVDKDSNCFGRVWNFRDVTARRRNELELKSKTALLEALVNSSIDGIMVMDENGGTVVINQCMIDFFSVPSEFLNDTASRRGLEHVLQQVKDPESFLAKFKYLSEHTTETSRDEVELKDNRVFDRYSAPVVDKDCNYFGRVWNLRDISNRKRNENALRQLSAAVEQSPVIVVIADLSGNITYVNPKFTEVTGYRLEEVLGKNPRILNSGHSPEGMFKELWRNIRNGRAWRGEFRNKKKNGELYWESATITPIFDASGAITSFLAVKEDITERRALESELRQAQKLEGIGQLAAGIAHEINTPTQFVTDNLTFLHESWESAKPVLDQYRKTMNDVLAKLAPEAMESLAKAEQGCDLEFIAEEVPRAIEQSIDGARRVAKIVRAMKEFSHPDSAEKSETDLNQGIRSTITVARNEWKYVAEMETNLDESLPPVFCYPGEVNQVILNLVVNAAHSIKDKMKDGEMGKIKVSTRNRGASVEIAIADSGMGIPESIQHRIYEPFFTTKDVGKGTGQGLSFAHSVVVKKHQGKIWFETEAGRGTTFFIELPIREPDAAKESDAQTSVVC